MSSQSDLFELDLFEFIWTTAERALVRVCGRWSDEHAPRQVTLTVSRGGAVERFQALPMPARRAQQAWRACFDVPAELLEDPLAVYRLQTSAGAVRLVPPTRAETPAGDGGSARSERREPGLGPPAERGEPEATVEEGGRTPGGDREALAEARALIGASWEALAAERARASRARRAAARQIAALEQRAIAAEEGASALERSTGTGAQTREETAAGAGSTGQARNAQAAIADLREELSRQQAVAEQLKRRLERERDARAAAEAERDDLAARLEQGQAERRAAQARADELPREPEVLLEQREQDARALAEQRARIQALELVNAQITEAARRAGAAHAELTAQVERLLGERQT